MSTQNPARSRHWMMLCVSVLVVIGSFLLQSLPNGRVAFRFCPQFPLPETCMSKACFGVECPGCGLTRSFIAIACGDWQKSIIANRVGWVLAFAVIIQIPYRVIALANDRILVSNRISYWFGNGLIGILLFNWFWIQCCHAWNL